MNDHVTLVKHEAPRSGSDRIASALPPDMVERVRGRVRVLALLVLGAFALDPVLFVIVLVVSAATGNQVPADFHATAGLLWIDVAAVVASAALWWTAGKRRVAPSTLLSLGLVYEVVICFAISVGTYWSVYIDDGTLPRLTWVPSVIILVPLILPGPPRRMLGGALAAAAMSPIGVALLDVFHRIETTPDAYAQSIVTTGIGVVFAYVGARVVYGLGREVAAARELGSYRLEERLGEGGMGEVWRARHRMLARPAAIKLIRPEMLDPGHTGQAEVAMQRFEREAQTTASLRSPHTVELYDFGHAADGTFYYVMELLEGLDAGALVDRHGPVPPERAVFLLTQVCHSLAEAHAAGLIHRDVKPANVFVCRYGRDADFVKVLDFGMVKTREDVADSPIQLTAEHVIGGTPAYIAPEQALGDVAVDHRADLYATGCLAYWLLTGCHVFDGQNVMEVLMHHARTPPRPPSTRTELPIPGALDRLVLDCLGKDPAARPQTATELATRLAACDGAGDWTPSRAAAWWDRHEPVARAAPAAPAARA